MALAESHWKRMMFRGCKVFAQVDAQGSLVSNNGKVTIKYQLDQEQQYSASASAVQEIDEEALRQARQTPAKKKRPAESRALPGQQPDSVREGIMVYTDGACEGNPGPAGIGVVLHYRNHTKEISRFIGTGTNNIAELTAIKVALQEIKDPRLPVVVHTDSAYCLGVLVRNWKAKSNRTLVEDIKAEMARFARLTLTKVKGHTGIEDNEKANDLAQQAVQRRTN